MGVLLPIVRSVCWPVVVKQISAARSFFVFVPAREVVFNGSSVEFYGVRVFSRRG